MKLEKLIGERFRERPADCVIDSHALMVKGGYMKYMANGIYSSYLQTDHAKNRADPAGRNGQTRWTGSIISSRDAGIPLGRIRPL